MATETGAGPPLHSRGRRWRRPAGFPSRHAIAWGGRGAVPPPPEEILETEDRFTGPSSGSTIPKSPVAAAPWVSVVRGMRRKALVQESAAKKRR
jgi:hypothetical protein